MCVHHEREVEVITSRRRAIRAGNRAGVSWAKAVLMSGGNTEAAHASRLRLFAMTLANNPVLLSVPDPGHGMGTCPAAFTTAYQRAMARGIQYGLRRGCVTSHTTAEVRE